MVLPRSARVEGEGLPPRGAPLRPRGVPVAERRSVTVRFSLVKSIGTGRWGQGG